MLTMFLGEAREARTPTNRFWRPVLCLVELTPRGCHGWILTSDLPLIGRLLWMLSYMAATWQGRLDSHQGPLASEASVLLG